MRLYLVQHGDAVPETKDPDRPLSKQGRADIQKLAAFLRSRLSVDRILHSGKTRARQTAEILAGSREPPCKVDTRAGIGPKDPIRPLVDETAGWGEDRLIVGHLPYLGRLTAALLTGSEDADVAAFRPGTLIVLERADDGRWRLLAMIRPELLDGGSATARK